MKDRRKKGKEVLAALREIIIALEKRELNGNGGISLKGSVQEPRTLELIIPLKPNDLFVWDEVLFND